MATHPDVAIVGGGIIGLTTAYFLARDGVRVTVLDIGDFGREASWAGAGILPPSEITFAKTPFDQLRARSVSMFPSFSAELKDRTGIDNGYLRCGGLELLGGGGAEAVEEWRGEGVEAQTLTAAEVSELEPALAQGLGDGIFLPGMAQVRNPWHLRALEEACRGMGVTFHARQYGFDFVERDRKIVQVVTAEKKVDAGVVVVAAGAWTDRVLRQFGISLGVRPVRGQIMLLRPPTPILKHIVLWGSQYLVPRGDGRILVGSTEEDAGFDKSNTVFGVHGLMHLAFKLVHALMEAPLEKCWSGLRPGSPDGLPFIGRVPTCDNLFVAAGHFRAGIQLSPGTALMLKEMILGETPTLAAEAFRVDRG